MVAGWQLPLSSDADIVADPADPGTLKVVARSVTGAIVAVDENGTIHNFGGGESGLQVVELSSDLTLTAAHNNTVFFITGEVTVTLPAGLSDGFYGCFVALTVADKLTFEQGSGAIITSSAGNAPGLKGPNTEARIVCRDGETWYICGDIGNTMVPGTIDDLAAWWDLTDVSTMDASAQADPIGSVQGKSPSDFTLEQFTGSNKPYLDLDVLNGYPAARFDGNDFFALPSSLLDFAVTNYTMFVVGWQAAAASGQFLIGGNSADDNWGIYSNGNKGYGSLCRYWSVTENGRNPTQPSLIVARREGNSHLLFNGLTQTASGWTDSGVIIPDAALGSRGLTVGGWNGWLAHVILYRRALPTEERTLVSNWLLDRYAL